MLGFAANSESKLTKRSLSSSFTEIANKIAAGQFSSKSCTIKNSHYDEYLYAATDGMAYNENRRTIFTWRPGDVAYDAYWSIEPYGDAFNIKNNYYNEYLYAATNGIAWDGDRRRVFTWRPGTADYDAHWYIEPVPSESAFRIRNTFYSEYLYAVTEGLTYDDKRRRVFTWRGGQSDYDTQWIINCNA